MKPIYTTISALFSAYFILVLAGSVQAQESCVDTQDLDQGYTTSISNVVDNGDNSYTITLLVSNDGCSGCKKLNRFVVEADPGTYSDISVEVLSGEFTFANINLGPNLGGDPYEGFRINNTNGMGNGQAASFALTYTITGALQDQATLSKAGSDNLIAAFTAADFQAVLNCLNPNSDILPYYNPLEDGKSYDIIGSELTSLFNTFSETGSYISDDIFQIVGNDVLITVKTVAGQYDNAIALLSTPDYGITEVVGSPDDNSFTGLYPISNLLLLNELPTLLISASPVYPALGNVGLVTSQGDISMRSYLARDGFQVDGEGVKIGVLSDSYNTILGNPAGDDIIKGDLPGADNPNFSTPVDVVREYPYGSRSDEGRAMLQIIHDVAPGAELAFRTGFLGANDFAQGILELQEAGCDIIVDDITYISEPFFRDGVVAQAVETVTDLGVSYFTAAGNFGEKSWQGTFAPVAAPSGIIGEAHNFANEEGGNDIYQSITLSEGNYTVVLQWDDFTPGNATSSDFDIYLATDNGTTLFGFNRVNTGGPAVEVLPFTVAAESANSNFLIIRESGTGPALLKYIVFRGNIDINEYATPGASTTMGQANAESAISVGAVLYSNTPEYGVDPPTVASFSSRGGTPVNGVLRAKPDITGPNGVNTSVDLGGVDFEGDGIPNFFGTSAAAPHVAAVGALVKQARQKYYDDELTPELLKGVLLNSAIDMYTPGYDPLSGAGFVQADAALQTLANPSPFVTGIFYDTTLVPGLDPILLTVYGQFLNEGSEIWFNGAPLEDGSTLQGDTAIVATIPPFDELYPEIQVFNPPLEGTNGSDGGLSNPLYFTTKETILVEINNATKKYGEVLPAFTASYSLTNVDGATPISESGLTDAEIDRILSVELTTLANPLSNVGLWAIEPQSNDPLNPNGNAIAEDMLDVSLLERFNFVFRNGLMTIERLDLVITPRDTTFVYNDSISSLNYDYLFNTSSLVSISPGDSLAILSALRLAHGTALVNAIGSVRGTALVNELGEPLLDAATLMNKPLMISQALAQARGTALVNGELIDANNFYDAAVQTNALTFTGVSARGTALVNGFKLARGTALVNTLDTLGNIVNVTALANETALVNSSAQFDATNINADSNKDVIVILGDGDIAILSGDSAGNVVIRSVSLITGRTVGAHLSVPGALLTTNFNVSYGVGGVEFLPDTAEIVLDPSSLSQIYDGSPKSILATTFPEGVEISILYNGSPDVPINAGTYNVEVSVADVNYVGSASGTLEILPAEANITFAAESLQQVYDGNPKTVSVSINPAGVDIALTYNGSPDAPINAGTYDVEVVVADNNYVGSASGTLEILPAEANITFDAESLQQLYDGNPKTVSVLINPADLDITLTYNGSPSAPTNAGSYDVAVTVNDPNYVGNGLAILEISPVSAIVSTGTYLIDEGDDLPLFEATFSGFVNGDDASVVTSLSFALSPALPSNNEAGIYEIIPTAAAENYTFTPQSGTLYVNPAGPGTKQVKPVFDCYEELTEADADGYGFIAYFSYINQNNAPVYVPIGPDNLISGADHNNVNQPELFLPGGGVVEIPYDGTSITWQVTSNKNNGSKGAIPANSSNKTCSKSGPGDQPEKPGKGESADVESSEPLLLYPNPSTGKVYIQLNGHSVSAQNVVVFDNMGKQYKANVSFASDQKLEIDLSTVSAGLYTVRIVLENDIQTIRVVITE